VVVSLGRIAFDACLAHLRRVGHEPRPKPAFAHGAEYSGVGLLLMASYHPSRQNTNTRRLTPEMLQRVFERARHHVEGLNHVRRY
jgi:uracil-DNA glycosylase